MKHYFRDNFIKILSIMLSNKQILCQNKQDQSSNTRSRTISICFFQYRIHQKHSTIYTHSWKTNIHEMTVKRYTYLDL